MLVVLPLPLFSCDEVKAIYFLLPNSSGSWRKFAFSFGSKWRCSAWSLAGLCLCCTLFKVMPTSNSWILYIHWIHRNRNITFTTKHFPSYWFSNIWKSLVHFHCGSHWCAFIDHLCLFGPPSEAYCCAGEERCVGNTLDPRLRSGSTPYLDLKKLILAIW